MAFAVTQRSHEIAIRMALGARRGDIARMVLSKATLLAAAGILTGVAGAAAMSRVLAGLLFGISATDRPTFAAAALALLGVAVLAAAIPAFRAQPYLWIRRAAVLSGANGLGRAGLGFMLPGC